jgi:hypothetical protein
MGYPPFDTEARREPLRALLNEITGVDIPTARLRGRPRIPLAALVDPTSRARLTAVLDRVVDETRPAATMAVPTIDEGTEATAGTNDRTA